MKIANLLIAAAIAFAPVAVVSVANAQDAAVTTTQQTTTTTKKTPAPKADKAHAKKHAAKAKAHAKAAKKEAEKANTAAGN